jgi:hypothetical protein
VALVERQKGAGPRAKLVPGPYSKPGVFSRGFGGDPRARRGSGRDVGGLGASHRRLRIAWESVW